MTAVDRDAPLRFLRTAFQPDDWVAVFLKSYQTGRTAQRVGPVSLMTDPRFQAWLRWRNLARWNVYVSVNAIAPGRRSRTRDAVRAIRHVFLEADDEGQAVLRTIAARRDLPALSYVLHSSPGRVHVFWRASGFSVDRVEAVQKLLARELRTDPAATPCTQTTRLPGFSNHKRQPPHVVTIEYRDIHRTCTPAEFPRPGEDLIPASSCGRGPITATAPDRLERARRYLAAVPPAITGKHGDVHTFKVCCRLVRGFALAEHDAVAALAEWNARCQPPWSERELLDKLRHARRYGREPIGGLAAAVPSRHRTQPRDAASARRVFPTRRIRRVTPLDVAYA